MSEGGLSKSGSNRSIDSQGNPFEPISRYDFTARGVIHDVQVEHKGGAWRFLGDGSVLGGKRHNKTNPLMPASHTIAFPLKTGLPDGDVKVSMVCTWSIKNGKWSYKLTLNDKECQVSWTKATAESGQAPMEVFGPPKPPPPNPVNEMDPALIPASYVPYVPPPQLEEPPRLPSPREPEPVHVEPVQAEPQQEARQETPRLQEQVQEQQQIPEYMAKPEYEYDTPAPQYAEYGMAGMQPVQQAGIESEAAYNNATMEEFTNPENQPCCGYGDKACFGMWFG